MSGGAHDLDLRGFVKVGRGFERLLPVRGREPFRWRICPFRRGWAIRLESPFSDDPLYEDWRERLSDAVRQADAAEGLVNFAVESLKAEPPGESTLGGS